MAQDGAPTDYYRRAWRSYASTITGVSVKVMASALLLSLDDPEEAGSTLNSFTGTAAAQRKQPASLHVTTACPAMWIDVLVQWRRVKAAKLLVSEA